MSSAAVNGSYFPLNFTEHVNGSSDGWTGVNGSDGAAPTTHPDDLVPCPCQCLGSSPSPSTADDLLATLPADSNVAFVWQYTLNWTHYYGCIAGIPTELLPTLSTAIDRNKGIAGWVLAGPSGLLCLFAVGLGHKLQDRLLQVMALVTYLAFHGVLAGSELVWMGHVSVAGVTLAGLAGVHARMQTIGTLRSRVSMFLIFVMVALEITFLAITVAASVKVLPSSRADWIGSILEQTIVSIFSVLNLIAIYKLAKSTARARSSYPEDLLVLEPLDEEPAKPWASEELQGAGGGEAEDEALPAAAAKEGARDYGGDNTTEAVGAGKASPLQLAGALLPCGPSLFRPLAAGAAGGNECLPALAGAALSCWGARGDDSAEVDNDDTATASNGQHLESTQPGDSAPDEYECRPGLDAKKESGSFYTGGDECKTREAARVEANARR